ncbi:EamA family transporter, partial [Candidatus Woesearchaeota archaeon]|nr:EamA family transporter [Candidatus Woesearchaeota archaeon]
MTSWIIFALLSAVFGAISMIFKKKTLFEEHATEFSTILKIFESCILAALLPFLGFKIGMTHGTLIFIYLLSVAVAVINVMSSKSFRHMAISKVVPLYNITPLFVLVLAFFILKEELTHVHLIGVLVLLAGTYLLEADHDIKKLSEPFKKIIHSKYMIIFLIALIISAFETVGEKFIISRTHPVTLLFFIYIFTAFNLTVLHTVMYDGFEGIVKGIKKSGKGIFLVAIFATLSNLAWFYALSMTFV